MSKSSHPAEDDFAGPRFVADLPRVFVEPGAPVDIALKKFTKKVRKLGVLRELADRRAAVTISQRRKRKAARALRRLRKFPRDREEHPDGG